MVRPATKSAGSHFPVPCLQIPNARWVLSAAKRWAGGPWGAVMQLCTFRPFVTPLHTAVRFASKTTRSPQSCHEGFICCMPALRRFGGSFLHWCYAGTGVGSKRWDTIAPWGWNIRVKIFQIRYYKVWFDMYILYIHSHDLFIQFLEMKWHQIPNPEHAV